MACADDLDMPHVDGARRKRDAARCHDDQSGDDGGQGLPRHNASIGAVRCRNRMTSADAAYESAHELRELDAPSAHDTRSLTPLSRCLQVEVSDCTHFGFEPWTAVRQHFASYFDNHCQHVG